MTKEEKRAIISQIKGIINGDDNLRKQIKPDTNRQCEVVFRAILENNSYDQQLQFWLGLSGEVNNFQIILTFKGWGSYEKKKLPPKNIEKPAENNPGQIEETLLHDINDRLNEMRRVLGQQTWCPDEYRNQLVSAPASQTVSLAENMIADSENTRPEGAVEPPETVATANVAESTPPTKKRATRQSDDSFLYFAEKVLKKIDYKSLTDGFWEDETRKFEWEDGKVQTFNPWLEFKLKGAGSFVLPSDDVKEINNYNKRKENKDTFIHLDAPPQPYIGDPQAKIWLLLMNPSYSAVDIFDLVEEQKGRTAIREDEHCRKARVQVAENVPSLDERRNLLAAQYKFGGKRGEIGHDFYVLSDKFMTIVPRDDTKHFGSYEWWNDYLLKQDICSPKYNSEKLVNKANLKNFFVLESFPYHSRNFDKIIPWKLSRSHCLFWVIMVAYALANKKILLCRGKDIAKRVAEIAEKICRHCADEAKQKQIFVCKNQQSFSVSTGNFISYEVQKKIDDLESEAKADFACKILKKLNEWKLLHDSAGA